MNGPATLYAASSADFTDITTGDIGGAACTDYRNVAPLMCRAGKGYDGPTGVGTPIGLAAFEIGAPSRDYR